MKHMKGYLLIFVVVAILFPAYTVYGGGPYTDDLSKCIIESTTPRDRTELVKWIFATASLHPAVKSIAQVAQKDRDAANKQTAELFIRMLTQTCKEKTDNAIKYEGHEAINASFQIFGQVAGRELFSSTEVTAGLAELDKYVDKEKLKAVFGPN